MGKLQILCICGNKFKDFSKAEKHKKKHLTHIQKIEATFDARDFKPFEAFAQMDFQGYSEYAFGPDTFTAGGHISFD